MKKFLFVFILSIGIGSLFAANGYDVSFNQPSNGTYELNFELGDYNLTEVTKNAVTYSYIDFEGIIRTNLEGYAELPYLNATVNLSADKNVDVKIIEGEYEDYSLEYPLLPSRGVIYRDQDPATIPYEINPSSYLDSWYPRELATSTSPFILKDLRGTTVYVYPFRYNAVHNILRVYKNLTVQLIEDETTPVNPLQKEPQTVLKEMDGIYKSLFINYNQTSDDLTIGEYGDILVICTDRDVDAIQPYIDWKMEKGFNVSLEVVATGTNVKTLVQDSYSANNNLLYVLLVGDWADIKSDAMGGAPTDPQLGCVVGSDDFADISIGRFSANNADHVTIQVNKVIEYEKNPDVGGSWYTSALGVASNQGPGDDNELDYEHIDVIYNDKLDPFTYDNFSTAYDPSGTSSMVAAAINDGVSVINYCGHGSETSWGSTGFSNNHIAQLTNGNKLPIIFSVACVNGSFTGSNDCFAEAWLKKSGGGAVMTMMSTINQPWEPPMRGEDYFNDILTGGYDYTAHPGQSGISTTEGRTTIGSITFNGLTLMCTESGGSSDWETAKTWVLFGDPSMQPRTDAPVDLNLSNNVVLVGLDYSTIITGPSGPVEGAMVCLSQNGEYYKGVTDASGSVTIPHTLTPGTAKLVVTGFNTETIYEDITVVPPGGAYVIVNECIVDDSDGNNNGQADYSETIMLDIAVENVGSDDALGVDALINTSDPYITILNDSYTYGDVLAGAIVPGENAFEIQIADDIPDMYTALFSIVFTDDSDATWTGTMTIILHAPVLTVQGFVIDDSNGNNNGRLDPGENADIIVPNTNEGSSDALNAMATAVSASGLVTVNNASYDLETIMAGETKDAIFSVSISSSAQVGDVAEVAYNLDAAPYSVMNVLSLQIGLVVEDFETGDFSSYGWEFSGNADWTIDQSNPYEGVYSAKSGNIGDEQTSNLEVTLNVTADDEISFFRKVSSESGYDYLRFYIDGSQQDEWSGEQGWEEFTYPVSVGEHTFKWEYYKDYTVSSGSDCGWIDFIVFPVVGGASPLGVVMSATPQEICMGESSQLNAFAMGGTGSYTYEWLPSTGLSDPTIANPVATPTSTTTYHVVVNDGDNTINDEITLTVHPIPETPIISIDDYMLVSDATEGNQWYNSNGPIAGATGQAYEPMATDTYYVIVTSEYGCESDPSNSIDFVYTGISEEINFDKISVYPNPNYGIFTVNIESVLSQNATLKVLDILGTVVYKEENLSIGNSFSRTIDLSNLNNGMYFLVFENYQGSAVNRIIIR